MKKILPLFLLLFACQSKAALVLEVSEEIVTGGVNPTTVNDQLSLSVDLTNGAGSASLAALRSFNQDTNTGGSAYFNRSGWTLSNIIFSGDTPGTSTATVGIGGQLTAALTANVAFGGFTGATSSVRVRYQLFYSTPTESVSTGGLLYEEVISVGGFSGPLEESREINEFVGTILTLPVDTPITLSMTLETFAGLDVAPGVATSNAGNSLTFNTDQFFDIQTSGVTANAGEFLVDNAALVPLPPALVLFASSLMGLGLISRSRLII